MLKKDYSIGVFDSGLGGLTVVKELMRQLPGEDIVYFGDTARVPYGTKSKEAIVRFSHENVKFLLKHKVKMIVVACNSSSSFALTSLRNTYPIPIVGVIVPGARKAAEVTKNKIIGVVATSATVHSGQYTKTLKQINKKIRVVNQPCPLFVPLVEEGWFHEPATELIAKKYLKKVLCAKADAIILGCTHYPLLKDTIQKILGPKVYLVDSAKEVARDVKELLATIGISNKTNRQARHQFFVSDKPQHFKTLAKRFLGCAIKNIKKVYPMYELTVKDEFAASHSLRDYEGKCKKLHGHTWHVDIVVRGKDVNNVGMLLDFKEIKNELKGILETLDHFAIF
ncbi:MAG: glutamate racemase [Candidatus Omnitrophica bacterium]|nr:glutamate racemase [Candidatus Omnitrophota bacterium]